MGDGGGGSAAGPRLRHPLLVAGRGLVARLRRRCRRAPFTHVVGYRIPTAAFAGEVDTLLDPATYGSRFKNFKFTPNLYHFLLLSYGAGPVGLVWDSEIIYLKPQRKW